MNFGDQVMDDIMKGFVQYVGGLYAEDMLDRPNSNSRSLISYHFGNGARRIARGVGISHDRSRPAT